MIKMNFLNTLFHGFDHFRIPSQVLHVYVYDLNIYRWQGLVLREYLAKHDLFLMNEGLRCCGSLKKNGGDQLRLDLINYVLTICAT